MTPFKVTKRTKQKKEQDMKKQIKDVIQKIKDIFETKGRTAAASPVEPVVVSSVKPIKKEEKTYKIAGLNYRVEVLKQMAVENDDYQKTKKELIDDGLISERVFQYDFYPGKIELIPEPDNPHDPNAIMVVVDGHHIGYIKAGSCARVRKMLEKGLIEKMRIEMGGGKYKYISVDYNENGGEKYYLEKSDSPYYAHLKILEK
jgi:hypothetical protein